MPLSAIYIFFNPKYELNAYIRILSDNDLADKNLTVLYDLRSDLFLTNKSTFHNNFHATISVLMMI